jgi:hypothetical protein
MRSFTPCGLALLALPMQLAADLVPSAIAAALCAPLVVCIDQAVTLSASRKQDLWPVLSDKIRGMINAPIAFFKSAAFLWVWMVYFLTYGSANMARTVAETYGVPEALPVLLTSTIANMSGSLAKDTGFARMYGTADKDDAGKGRRMPRATIVAWLARDALTMAFVFTLPGMLAGVLPDLACRLGTPIVAQYFTTPLHLLGLQMYNVPGGHVSAQLSAVRAAFKATVAARQLRIFPAFFVGGVTNKGLVALFKSQL